MKRLINIIWAALRRHKVVPLVPCPYCLNPNRDSVYDNYKGCKWVNPNPLSGSDPPCVCDGYGTKKQLRQLGLAR